MTPIETAVSNLLDARSQRVPAIRRQDWFDAVAAWASALPASDIATAFQSQVPAKKSADADKQANDAARDASDALVKASQPSVAEVAATMPT